MIVETVTAALRHYFDKYGDIPLKAEAEFWKEYVSPLAVRGQMIVLQTQKAEAFTVPTLNYLVHQWETMKAQVVVQGSNGRLYSVQEINIESKSFSGVETCILLTLAAI